MIAEINGKLGGRRIHIADRLEDELTGNFFGNMRYFSFDKGMKKVLRKAKSRGNVVEILDRINLEDWVSCIKFWPRVKLESNQKIIEPDVQLDLENATVFIEVKYNSALSFSDEKNEINNSQVDKEGISQLELEAQGLEQIADNNTKILILLAKEAYVCQVCESEPDKGESFPKDVKLGYIAWEDVFDVLQDIEKTDDLSSFEKVIIGDVSELLKKKGFERFRDFDMCKDPVIESHASWKFDF